MRTVTAFTLLLVSAAFAPAWAIEPGPASPENVISLRPLSGALTPQIVLPRLQGLTFSADPIHTSGWRDLDSAGGGGNAGADLTDAAITPEAICQALKAAAAAHDLPLLFFARLIWQESRFKPNAVSRAGAQGVAQFMPKVAAEMGLADPFDPVQALPMSARLLSRLYERFGNWGLAAAAYNGGPRRVQEWLSRKGGLPRETRHYVQTITGITAEQWVRSTPRKVEFKRPPRIPCEDLPPSELHAVVMKIPLPPVRPELAEITEASAAAPAVRKIAATKRSVPANGEPERGAASDRQPWAVQLAAHWSPKQALAAFERLRKKHPAVLADRKPTLVAEGRAAAKRQANRRRVQIAMASRTEAEQLCSKLRSSGGACLVRRN
jgi:hypothetical protein